MSTWVMVDSAELGTLAGGFHLASDELATARGLLRRELMRVGLGGGGALATAHTLRLALEAALAACETLLISLGDREAALRSTLRAYDGAEARASWEFLRLPGWLGMSPGVPSIVPGTNATIQAMWHWARGEPLLPGALVEQYGTESNVPLLGWLATRVVHLRPDDPVATAAREITLLPPQPSAGFPAAAGAGDLADRVELAYDASGPTDSAIDVQRIDHADGSVSWTVSVPGTMGGLSPASIASQPMSLDSNVSAYLGLSSAVDTLVIAAMTRAGVRRGEPIVLAGHSLGGMTVAQLALDSRVREQFTIAAVVTYGAPAAHMPALDVPMLNLQHAEDGVPALSGEIGPRRGGPADREVVVARELGDDAGRGVDAHDIERYSETAHQIQDANHPGMLAWDEATADLWARDGDTVTATTYRGFRAD